ncbi:MAG: ABC transporter ATP-binding protein [Gammaproteobacteria bacterium]|jgi:ABC-2 type transport system ATP-binding protein
MNNNAPYIIDVKNLNKSFDGHSVVRNVALRVKQGEIFGFLGPNGSGKTTTIRMICGLLTPDSGQGTCLGFDILKDAEQIKAQVGYMTQKFSYYDDLTVYENLDFMARVYELPNRQKKIKETLDYLGLSAARAKQLAGTLSGGWKQRLALAGCLLHEPKLLLLDEPTAGVDPKARRDFWDRIQELSDQGITTLVSTHYMDEALRCTRLAYIAYGDLLAEGTSDEIIKATGLNTWQVKGDSVQKLAKQLRGLPGIQQVALFGQELHVSGEDAQALEKAIAPFRQDYEWQLSETSLEDVFIHLVGGSEDNF